MCKFNHRKRRPTTQSFYFGHLRHRLIPQPKRKAIKQQFMITVSYQAIAQLVHYLHDVVGQGILAVLLLLVRVRVVVISRGVLVVIHRERVVVRVPLVVQHAQDAEPLASGW